MAHSIPLCTDPHQVERLAATLQISEFDLFARAYQDWFGRPAPRASLETAFMQYLYYDQMPYWVRHYCRQPPGVLLHQGPEVTKPAAIKPRYGSWYAIGFLCVLIVLIVLFITLFSQDTPLSSLAGKCYFPPCY